MKALFAAVTTAPDKTPEELIAFEARVSSPHRQHLNESAGSLLRYCLVNSHWSPFDMVDLTVEIETSRGIMAQILRHWSFRFQEFSQRYADPQAAGLAFEPVEMRLKHEGGNRQGSGQADEALTMAAQEIIAQNGEHYGNAIANGVAPESARFMLTLATTTRGYMKGSARSWMTYFWQRLDRHAQKEHRDLAWMAFDVFADTFPLLGQMVLDGKPFYVENAGIANLIQQIKTGDIASPQASVEAVELLSKLLWNPEAERPF